MVFGRGIQSKVATRLADIPNYKRSPEQHDICPRSPKYFFIFKSQVGFAQVANLETMRNIRVEFYSVSLYSYLRRSSWLP